MIVDTETKYVEISQLLPIRKYLYEQLEQYDHESREKFSDSPRVTNHPVYMLIQALDKVEKTAISLPHIQPVSRSTAVDLLDVFVDSYKDWETILRFANSNLASIDEKYVEKAYKHMNSLRNEILGLMNITTDGEDNNGQK